MGLFESIADRRIREARRAGLFDNLPGAGKPIADLGRERPAGWWANRVVREERDKAAFEDLDGLIKKAMPSLWRLKSEREVAERVAELNALIDGYNAKTTFQRRNRLDEHDVVGRWRELRRPGSGAGAGST